MRNNKDKYTLPSNEKIILIIKRKYLPLSLIMFGACFGVLLYLLINGAADPSETSSNSYSSFLDPDYKYATIGLILFFTILLPLALLTTLIDPVVTNKRVVDFKHSENKKNYFPYEHTYYNEIKHIFLRRVTFLETIFGSSIVIKKNNGKIKEIMFPRNPKLVLDTIKEQMNKHTT